jgi:hypothetical protein
MYILVIIAIISAAFLASRGLQSGNDISKY